MKTNAWIRARHAVIDEEVGELKRRIADEGLGAKSPEEKEKRLLLAGYFPEGYDEEELVGQMLADRSFSNEPLSFEELSSWSAWYALHPDRVFGEEAVTTSREFPLTVKGNEEEIKQHFRTYFTQMSNKRKKQRELREKLARIRREHFGLDGLGYLGKAPDDKISALALRDALVKNQAEEEYQEGDLLDFDKVVETYNKAISEDEIRAWVWYKRSLGTPMTGWERYYLSTRGERTVMLYTKVDTVILDNRWIKLRTVPAGRLLGKWTGKSHEYDGVNYMFYRDNEGMRSVNEDHIREEVTEVSFAEDAELDHLVKTGALFYLDGELLPLPVYSYGNMYDRELQLREDEANIRELYGDEVFQRHREVISNARPDQLSILHPDPRERPRISAISDFARKFEVEHLREEYNAEFEEPMDLRAAFYYFLKSLDHEEFNGVSAYEITAYYVNGVRITSRDLTKEQKAELRANTRNEGERLFARFLHEALTLDDQKRLDMHWNRLYNGQSSLAYHKIPIGFEASAKFKQFNLEVRPAQREGVAFINAVGSGIIAYDVGVGKTMTAIISLADAIYSGKAKRPLIVVPNPTYKKWIGEIIGYTDRSGKFIPGVLSFTDITINDWYNLGKKYASKIDFEARVPERSITIVTYEGMKKIGYSQAVMDEMFDELANILGQEDDDITQRQQELEDQKYREMIGVGLKNTIADIDALGFDALVIDEAHRCKNIFEGVKKDDDGRRRYGIQGAVSETGIKAFFLCNFIQRRHGRNVTLLTATPFTNSPLEIYSMLSLVAYDAMRHMGILNIKHFFQLFVQETTEYVVNYKEEVVPKDVIKRFNNRLILQKLIYNHIIYKTGEEAGIKRPCKVNLPRVNENRDGQMVRLKAADQTLTYLNMTDEQRRNQNAITNAAKMATSGKVNKGLLFRALGKSLDNALSPFLYGGKPVDYMDFVEESPKILYTMECIRTVKEYHEKRGEPVSGQVIYMNRGKDFFPLIKEYLVEELGYKMGVKWGRATLDEVEVISSGMSTTRKENIKEAFLEGVVKIIIGTATIREGIDLQKKSTVLYNLYPDWNPTDIRQLEGRIWRQGNRHGFVRVVMPLVQDSMDVFVFQKLDEKTSRINDIWYRGDRGNVLDLESLDPEEVKFALITDVEAIAKMKLKVEKQEMERKYKSVKGKIETLKQIKYDLNNYRRYREASVKIVEDVFRSFASDLAWDDDRDPKEMEDWTKKQKDDYRRSKRALDAATAFVRSPNQTDKELLKVIRLLMKQPHFRVNTYTFNYFREAHATIVKVEKNVLSKKGFTLESNFDDVIRAYEKDKAELEEKAKMVGSPEYLKSLIDDAAAKKSALQVDGKTVEERAEDFAKLNYLMSFPASSVDNHNCVLPPPSAERKAKHPDRERVRAKLRLRAKAARARLLLLDI